MALYVTACGLTTSPIPFGSQTFQIDFDFIDHRLSLRTSDGSIRIMELAPRSVADFYAELMARLAELDVEVKIQTTPNEVRRSNPV